MKFAVILSSVCLSASIPFDAEQGLRSFDKSKYLGKWVEYYNSKAIRNGFQVFCFCSRAQYSPNPSAANEILIKNNCNYFSPTGFQGSIGLVGTQNFPDTNPAGVAVGFGFFSRKKINYVVLDAIEEDGRYVASLVAGEKDAESLWLLSRTATLKQEYEDRLLRIAAERFDLDKIQFRKVDRTGCADQ